MVKLLLKPCSFIVLLCMCTLPLAGQNKNGGGLVLGYNFTFYTPGLSNMRTLLYQQNAQYQGNYDYSDQGAGLIVGGRWENGNRRTKWFADLLWINAHRQFKSTQIEPQSGVMVDAKFKSRLNVITFDMGMAVKGIGFGIGLSVGNLNIKSHTYDRNNKWDGSPILGRSERFLFFDRAFFNVFVQYDFWILTIRGGYNKQLFAGAFTGNSNNLKPFKFNAGNFNISTSLRLGNRCDKK